MLAELPDALHAADCGLLAWPPEPPDPVGGRVVVVAAGTADHAVAREALLTARHLGRTADLIMDVGVAGLHRLLGRLDVLRAARVIVVVAGMDGALPAVVAGLVAAPVVAVPTSTGYGASFEGLARPAHDAQQLRARGGGGQHRQRLRRRPPGRSDRCAVLSSDGRPTAHRAQPGGLGRGDRLVEHLPHRDAAGSGQRRGVLELGGGLHDAARAQARP